MSIFRTIKVWAQRIKRDALTVWFACADRATPWHARALAAFVVAYAFSPIDLIPDFIPVLGYVDDFVLLPLLIWLTVRLLPDDVLALSRRKAEQWLAERGARPRSRAGAAAILLIWLTSAGAMVLWFSSIQSP